MLGNETFLSSRANSDISAVQIHNVKLRNVLSDKQIDEFDTFEWVMRLFCSHMKKSQDDLVSKTVNVLKDLHKDFCLMCLLNLTATI